MTPKEKAKELIDKFNNHTVKELVYLKNGKVIEGKTEAKECALIAVNEILKIEWDEFEMSGDEVMYWQEVKQEIENL